MSPIPLEDLKRGRFPAARPGSNPERVLAFLREHPTEAWRAVEIAAALDIEQHTLGAVLRRLAARGYVGKKEEYWFALDEEETATLQMALAVNRYANEKLGPEDPADWPSIDRE
ncbi:MAG TPA: helix-turn-helix domain-containing protein [Candidatus Thermoplasmatota archaeon]|nr:helix-turn-helix domain-containing protein [Candidatus Thermoplasmatota archaeon]